MRGGGFLAPIVYYRLRCDGYLQHKGSIAIPLRILMKNGWRRF